MLLRSTVQSMVGVCRSSGEAEVLADGRLGDAMHEQWLACEQLAQQVLCSCCDTWFTRLALLQAHSLGSI